MPFPFNNSMNSPPLLFSLFSDIMSSLVEVDDNFRHWLMYQRYGVIRELIKHVQHCSDLNHRSLAASILGSICLHYDLNTPSYSGGRNFETFILSFAKSVRMQVDIQGLKCIYFLASRCPSLGTLDIDMFAVVETAAKSSDPIVQQWKNRAYGELVKKVGGCGERRKKRLCFTVYFFLFLFFLFSFLLRLLRLLGDRLEVRWEKGMEEKKVTV